jgi:hypothetical protein
MKTYDELIEMCVRELEMVRLKTLSSIVATKNLRLEADNLKRNIKHLKKEKQKHGHTK